MEYQRVLSDDGVIKNVIDFNDDGELHSRDIMSGEHVQEVLDANAHDRNHGIANKNAHGRLAARIPLPVYANWRKDWQGNCADRWTWQTYLAQKLADPDYAYLRTGMSEISLTERNRQGGIAEKKRPSIQRVKSGLIMP